MLGYFKVSMPSGVAGVQRSPPDNFLMDNQPETCHTGTFDHIRNVLIDLILLKYAFYDGIFNRCNYIYKISMKLDNQNKSY